MGHTLVCLTLVTVSVFQVPPTDAEVLSVSVSHALLTIAHERIGRVTESGSHGAHAVMAGLGNRWSYSRRVLAVATGVADGHAKGIVTVDAVD